MAWWAWLALGVFMMLTLSASGLLLWRKLEERWHVASLVRDVDEGVAFGGEYEE